MRKQHILLVGLTTTLILLCIIAGLLFMRNHKNKSEDFPRGTVNEYTLTDVQENNTNASCWISYGARVFDITRFVARLDSAQANELTKICGTNIDTLPTSIKTADNLTEYQIGILAP